MLGLTSSVRLCVQNIPEEVQVPDLQAPSRACQAPNQNVAGPAKTRSTGTLFRCVCVRVLQTRLLTECARRDCVAAVVFVRVSSCPSSFRPHALVD